MLFDNTARAISGASQEVLEHHVANCGRADPAYGAGVARALSSQEHGLSDGRHDEGQIRPIHRAL
ncbi:MAG: catalase-related domain-containing protein [Burkholderiales bacterium]